jgi:glycosyltransferase involved in cell wall biosynthesis
LWSPASLRDLGGGTRWILDVAQGLEECGHKATIFATPMSLHNFKSEYLITQLKGIPYFESWKHHIKDFDLAYVMYSPFWRLLSIKCPVVGGIHTAVYFQRNFFNPITCFKIEGSFLLWLGKLYYSSFSWADLRRFSLTHLLVPTKLAHNRTFYVPNWVDTSYLIATKNRPKDFSVLFVGRPTWEKGWDIFSQTAQITRSRNSAIRFLATGSGSNDVQDLGIMTDRVKMYSLADLMILPARANVFPLTILESLSTGTPVIASRLQSHLSLGLPIMYGDNAQEISNTVIQLWNVWNKSPAVYEQMRIESRRAALKYDKKLIFPKFVEMLHKAINLEPAPVQNPELV